MSTSRLFVRTFKLSLHREQREQSRRAACSTGKIFFPKESSFEQARFELFVKQCSHRTLLLSWKIEYYGMNNMVKYISLVQILKVYHENYAKVVEGVTVML